MDVVTNRVHTSYLLPGSRTGRLASRDPNLQNIPRASEIKNLFIARPGHKLVEVDSAQAELRWLAFHSQDPGLLQVFREGRDIHSAVASRIYNLPEELFSQEEYKEQRVVAKTINFGLIYGRGAASVAAQLTRELKRDVSVEEAEGYIRLFFNEFPGVLRWRNGLVAEASATGFVRSYYGRKRRLPDLHSEDLKVRGHAEREAYNAAIQADSSDSTQYGGLAVQKELKDKYDFQSVLTVHDSYVWEVREDQAEAFAVDAVHIFENVAGSDVNVPFKADASIGDKWGSLCKFKEAA